jgi:cytidine deaminase
LSDSEAVRLSVAMIDVLDGRDGEFHAVHRELAELVASKGYANVDLFRDEASSRRFYAVRRWASTAAAEQCHGDGQVQELTARLHQVARVTHVVNGLRRADSLRLLMDDRRTMVESDRRIGFDRRIKDVGRPEGDRRSGVDRRLGPRRLQAHPCAIDLVAAARRARERADAAFSHFKVGAALEALDGTVIVGCNIENATYGLTICAERVAMFKALSEGHRAFTRIAVVADTEAPTPPCGACRQILWEFGGDLEVVLASLSEEKARHRLKDLLPHPFDARLL